MFVQGLETNQDKSDSDENSEEEGSGDVLQKRREECERKARRGEMDPRLEFAFQLLMDATGLPRHEVMDHVFEGDMLDEINQLFLPHMRATLLWFYQEVEEPESQRHLEVAPIKNVGPRVVQNSNVGTKAKEAKEIKECPKKKLFLTDGWQMPCTGICIYMLRINVSKQLPEEGFQKDLYTGIIDTKKVSVITYVQRVIEFVFMDALAHPGMEDEDDRSIIKTLLLPGLRSFCSALKVCEEVAHEGTIFQDGISMMDEVQNYDDAKALISKDGVVEKVEKRVREWIRKLKDFMLESKQVRRENDNSGPQQELEYWKKRGSQFSQLTDKLQDHEVKMALTCLQAAKSKLMKDWTDLEDEITYCFNEAKDNAKFIQALEKCCHCLYLDDPVKMRDSLVSLLQTVRLIYSVSKFYNTSERTSSLMVKITNQMIVACRDYVTKRGRETVWSQDRATAKQRLKHCLRLNKYLTA